jgi:GNAT superfamily N-acetyltransferase
MQEEISLRPARPEEAAALTALCLRSKAFWGYSADFMRACAHELTLSPRDFASSQIQAACARGRLVGMAQVRSAGATVASLDKLFVEPAAIRCGAGTALLAWAVEATRAAGAHMLTIEADPHAADFYRRLGATDAGVVASGSVPGRTIPKLVMDLGGTARVSDSGVA